MVDDENHRTVNGDILIKYRYRELPRMLRRARDTLRSFTIDASTRLAQRLAVR